MVWRKAPTIKNYLVNLAIRFIVAHELGHIYKGHLRVARKGPLTLSGRYVDHAVHYWSAEYEADSEAFEFGDLAPTVSINREQRASGATWGAELFFCASEILEGAFSVIEFGDTNHALNLSHPPPQLRRKMLRSNVKSLAMRADNGNEFTVNRLLAPGLLLETVSAELWKTVEDCFLNLHTIGYRTAPVWRETFAPTQNTR